MKSTLSSAFFGLLVAALVAAFSWPASAGRLPAAGVLGWAGFVGAIGFLILKTGTVGRWRAVFFVTMAWGFLIHFKMRNWAISERLFTTTQATEVPYCHIAMASSILNYLYQQYLAAKSGAWKMWGPLSLGFVWLAATLAVGQAWCSWVCFYGGLDDGFSRLLKRPFPARLFNLQIGPRLRELPAALLIFMILISFSTLLPVFCIWVCPLKITTAFLDPDDSARKLQLAIFSTLGILTLVIIPIFTRKRAFCGLICPFGAWQAFFGQLNPFRVTIQGELCTQCRLCVYSCPTFVLSTEGVKNHEVGPYCNRCGVCMDVCAHAAIDYTVLGRPAPWARAFFVFGALLMGGSIGALFMPQLISQLARRCLGL